MYSNDVQWLSQNIFSHRDKEYGTEGFMRVSISTNTKDSMSFSAPTFVINIKNGSLNKTCSLTFQMLFDVRNRLKEVVDEAVKEYKSNESSPESQLHYKTGKSSFLTFEFLRGSQQGEPCVRITISHGTSDSTKIIMPFSPEFVAFLKMIGDMVGDQRKYLDWCLHFPNRFYMIEVNQVMKQIPGLIKNAVVQIDRSETSNNVEPKVELYSSEVDNENLEAVTETMEEMNAFMGSDMENIDLKLPAGLEIDTEAPKTVSVEENKFSKWLGNDVKNFENVIMRCAEKSNSIRQLEKELSENYDDFDYFPGITDQEMKSIIYLSGREYFVYNGQANHGPIQRSFSINKYKGTKAATPQNMELAYNLLVLMIFIKLCRDKIEEKTNDNYENKTLVHLATSLIASPFIFSFIDSETTLASIIKDKYRQMDEAGMFDSYKKSEFESYGFTISEMDIIGVCDRLSEKYFASDSFKVDTHMRHVSMYNSKSCLLDPDNALNEEQIINQLVPFEIHIISNDISLDDRKNLTAYAKENKLDSNVLGLFVKALPTKNIPIVKFFENNINDVPEEIRSEFMEEITEYNERDYDLSDKKFSYDTFSDEAIKALFLWKPVTGEKFKTYKKFYKAVVASTHDKNTILSMLTHDEDASGETFADFDFAAVGKEN